MFSTRKIWFADILFKSEFNLKIIRESMFMRAKTDIKPSGDQSLCVSWISERKDILSNIEINIISQ